MKIVTTNKSGRERIGGIPVRLNAQLVYSPQHQFYVLEHSTGDYPPCSNLSVTHIELPALIGYGNIKDYILACSSADELLERGGALINRYEITLETIEPDLIIIPGTSLTSLFFLEAARKLGMLKRTVHLVAGILDMEIQEYSDTTQSFLHEIGNKFVDPEITGTVTYIFPSNLARTTFEGLHGVQLKNAFVVYNGVPQICAGANRVPPTKTSLGYIGRMRLVKNPEFFFDLNRFLGPSIGYHVVSDFDFGINSHLRQRLEGLNEEIDLRCHPPMDIARLVDFYSNKISALVVPSHFETFSNVALESIACGTPALVSEHAGVRELLYEFGLESFLFSPQDIESFKAVLSVAKGMGFKIHRDISMAIIEKYSWKKTVERYNMIAEGMLEPQH